MHFDPENDIVKKCAQGMCLEGEGKMNEAHAAFADAWNCASSDLDKFIAAHYVARHQNSIAGKLNWDRIALTHALQVKTEEIKSNLPSLYLNVAKCYEDLGDFESALENYQLAQSFTNALGEDGYSKMIRSGIVHGLSRIQVKTGIPE